MKREWLGRLALVVLGPVFVLAAIELALLALDIGAPGGDEDAHRSGPPGNHFDADARVRQLEGQQGKRRVACFGGSSMAGMPLDYRLSMCTMAAKALGPDVEPLFDAGRGMDSQDLLNHAEATCQFGHELVLIYAGHNEFLNLHRFEKDTPEAVREAFTFADNFRLFRVLRGWFGPGEPEDTHGRHLGDAQVADAEVYARYERNIRRMLELCGKHSPVVLATVVSNDRFTYPFEGKTARQTAREVTKGAAPRLKSRFEAKDPINVILRRIAADTGVPFFDVEPVIAGRDPDTLFWDAMHPRPELHLILAKGMLAAAKVPTAPVLLLSDKDRAEAAESSAFYALGFDPAFALRALRAIKAPQNQFSVSMATVIAGFLTDDGEAFHGGLAEAERLLAVPQVAQVMEACAGLGPGPDGQVRVDQRGECGLTCLPLPCSANMMSPEEKAELLGRVTKFGNRTISGLVGAL
jgi:hypothetical protein